MIIGTPSTGNGTSMIRFAILALIFSFGAVPLWGDPQVYGSVQDEEGAPVGAASVALRSPDGVLATVTTDQEGAFRFTGPFTARGTELHVGRLGYRSARVPVPSNGGEVQITLEADPVELEGLRVQAEQDVCGGEEESEARALWEALRERHETIPDTLGMATYMLAAESKVPQEEVGSVAAGELEEGQRGSAPLLRFGWTRRIERQGYAFPVRRTGPEGSYDSWSYPPLESELAFHFVSSLFGELHTFHRTAGTGEPVLFFCSRNEEGPALRGQLHLSPDTTLTAAEWLYRTPEPDERSGGRVYFAGPGDGETLSGQAAPPRYLVPSEGLFWRQEPGGDFRQRYQRYEGWVYAPGDSVPFLPRRNP